MSKKDFNLMTYGEFYRWWYDLKYKYDNNWDGEEYGEPFSFGKGDAKKWYIDYKGLTHDPFGGKGVLTRILYQYVNHSASPDVITMVKQNEGSLIRWDYESLCEFLNEPPYLLLPDGELKYFWERKASEFPAHLDRLFSELRYKVIDPPLYNYTRTAYYSAIRSDEDNDFSGDYTTVEGMKNFLSEKLSETWDNSTWEENLYADPGYSKSSTTSWYRSKTVPYSANGDISVCRSKIRLNQMMSGRYYFYVKIGTWANIEKSYSAGLFENLPDNPTLQEWYNVIRVDNEKSENKNDYHDLFWGDDKKPSMEFIYNGYEEDSQASYTTYGEGFYVDHYFHIYDIQPEKPTTFLP